MQTGKHVRSTSGNLQEITAFHSSERLLTRTFHWEAGVFSVCGNASASSSEFWAITACSFTSWASRASL